MDRTSTGSGSGSDQQEEVVTSAGAEIMAEEGDVQPLQQSNDDGNDEVKDVNLDEAINEAINEAAAGDADQGLFTPPRLEEGEQQAGNNGQAEGSAIDGEAVTGQDVEVELPIAVTSTSEEKEEKEEQGTIESASVSLGEEAGTPRTAAADLPSSISVLLPTITAEAMALLPDEQLLEEKTDDDDNHAVSSAIQAVTPPKVDATEEKLPLASDEGAEAAEGIEEALGESLTEEAKEDVSKGKVQDASKEEEVQDTNGTDSLQVTAPAVAAEEPIAPTSSTDEAAPATVTFASPPVQDASRDTATAETTEKVDEANPNSEERRKQPDEASPADTSLTTSKPSPPIFASPATTPKSALGVASPTSSPSVNANDPIVKQIALVLKINKELIR